MAYNSERFGTSSSLGRENKTEVVLRPRLQRVLQRFNPGLPDQAYLEAIRIIEHHDAAKSMSANNEDKYRLYTEGVKVTYKNEKGQLVRDKTLRLFDFISPESNDFLVVRQL